MRLSIILIFILLSCSRKPKPVEIECPDPEPVTCPRCDNNDSELIATKQLYEMRSRQVDRCMAEKEVMKDERKNLESEINHLNEESEMWRQKYMDTPTCDYDYD